MILDTKKNINLIYDKLKSLNNLPPEGDINNYNKLNFCLPILANINKDSDEWINSCSFSIGKFTRYISKNDIDSGAISDELYLTCGMILREYILTMERKGAIPSWIIRNWYDFKNKAKQFISEENYHRLDYLISGGFDIDVINKYLGNRSFQAFLN